MKKHLSKVAGIALLAVIAAPYAAMAQAQNITPPITSLNQLTSNAGFVCKAVNWIFTFLILIAIIFALIAAFKYLTAAGDPEKVKGASHTLIYAAVAVGVGIIAKGVPLIVGSFFGSTFTGC